VHFCELRTLTLTLTLTPSLTLTLTLTLTLPPSLFTCRFVRHEVAVRDR